MAEEIEDGRRRASWKGCHGDELLGPVRRVRGHGSGRDEPRELSALGRAAQWLNSPQLTSSSLRGKVVVVDFWTYTCINWLRTLA